MSDVDRVNDEIAARRAEIEDRLHRLRARQSDLAHLGPEAVSPASARAAAQAAIESLARSNRAHLRVSDEHIRAGEMHLRTAERLEKLGHHDDAATRRAAAGREFEAAEHEARHADGA